MKKFFETLCCILLTVVLLIVVGNYFENKDEPKEDDPIADVEKETKTVFFTAEGPESINNMECEYYDGMTWAEFIELNELSIQINENGELVLEKYTLTYCYADEEAAVVKASDLVVVGWGGDRFYAPVLTAKSI